MPPVFYLNHRNIFLLIFLLILSGRWFYEILLPLPVQYPFSRSHRIKQWKMVTPKRSAHHTLLIKGFLLLVYLFSSCPYPLWRQQDPTAKMSYKGCLTGSEKPNQKVKLGYAVGTQINLEAYAHTNTDNLSAKVTGLATIPDGSPLGISPLRHGLQTIFTVNLNSPSWITSVRLLNQMTIPIQRVILWMANQVWAPTLSWYPQKDFPTSTSTLPTVPSQVLEGGRPLERTIGKGENKLGYWEKWKPQCQQQYAIPVGW